MASVPLSGSTYERGEQITVRLEFDKAVDVSGTPQVALGIGSQTRQADYFLNLGGRSVLFWYVVVQADADTDGISVAANALTLNGGSIKVAGGDTDALLGLGANAITNSSGHKVDGMRLTAPAVKLVAIDGSPLSGSTYERDEVINVSVYFDRTVAISGTPQLALGIGSQTRQASWRPTTGEGTTWLLFRYTVVQADEDTDGISVGATALTLNGGTINDSRDGTVAASLGLGANAITNSGSHKVDGARVTAPAVTGVSIESSPSSGSTYELGEVIEVKVTFGRAVDVGGTPQLALGIGTEARQANYVSGTGTASLTFRYTVVAADSDSDGLSVGASALGLNSGTINDRRDGTVAASLGLGTNAITNSSGHMVDGTRATAPVVTGLAIGSPVVGDTFERGDTIEVTVTFNKVVDVSGTPQLALKIGSRTQQASYASGTGTTSLVFRYTVASGDADHNGLSIWADALGLNGGTIDVAGGTTDALLGLGANGIGNSRNHKVAGGTFTASAVSGAAITSTPASGSTYGLGERIEVQLTFNRPVTVTGAPQLALGIGTATRQASYASSLSTATVLVFRYTVQAADRDGDGLSVGATGLGLNSGTINDARDGTTAASLGLGTNAITNSSSHMVDGTQGPPGVTGVAIGSPVVGDTFERGEAIEVAVTFNKAVDVGGTPQLALGIGTATRQASYASGTGTASLVFRYTVVQADADTDGISVAANALSLNSGTIDVAGGTTDALLGLGANAITNSSSHKVAGGTFTASAVNGAAIASSPAGSSTYGLSERIEVAVTFTRPVTVTGTPQLALEIGTETRQANYVSGTGTDSLTFRYAVVAADSDGDGISVAATALALNSGAINDARDGTTAASLGLGTNAITNDGDHMVDGSQGPPGVTGVAIGAPVVGDTFERGEAIEVTVTFNKAVDVSGTPQLALGIGTETRQASYASGTGTASLVFRYTVVQGDADTDGISIAADALSLNSGTIDVAGGTTDALLGLGASAIENSGSHKVAGGTFTASAVSGAAIASSPASGSTYGLGEQIEVQLTFNRTVTVTGVPQLALGIGTVMRQASYASGSSTATTLTFQYTVQASDSDSDGLSVGATALGLNSGTINDARDGTTAASLGLGTNAITNSSSHKVDGAQGPPGVTGVAIGSPTVGSTFERDDTIEVTVTFNKAVDVSGTPQLALGIGMATRQASYASGTGTASLVFRYVVVQADADNDGLSIAANALSLNSGTIDVAGGTTDALLGLGANAIENSGSHKVAGGTLTASAVSGTAITSSPSSGSTYGLGEQIEVRLTFNRPVTVTGAPQLALGIGSETRQASYASSPSTATVLVFRYTVQVADSDSDGLSVAATALTLNSGTINDARDGTTAASLGLGTNAITNDGDHMVDSSQGPPGVAGVSIGSPAVSDTFERDEVIEVTVTFNKAVDVSGTPQLALGIGTETRQASYASGTGTASLVFRYTVVQADADTDGLSIAADALSLNSGTIDVAGGTTDALLGLGANAISNSTGHKVDGSLGPPRVTEVLMASLPLSGSTYERGEQITVRLEFDKAVDVSGTPQVALGIGSQTRQADYFLNLGGRSVLFWYVVVQADADTDGISVAANALTLNGGSIKVAGGDTDALLGLGANAITNSSGHKVDGMRLTAPAVKFVAIDGSPLSGSTYERDEVINVSVYFDRTVAISGTPQLALGIGSQTRQASWRRTTGERTTWLLFRYTVVQADEDTDGISVGATALGLNGGTINDSRDGTVAASLGLGANAITNSSGHKVDGARVTAPAVTGVSIESSPLSESTYELGEVIEVKVTFDRAVDVGGTPQLALGIGTATRQANYVSGTGTASLTFRYTVVAADSDSDGLSVGATALRLNGGSINDRRDGTVAASLGLGTNAITNSSGHMVDGTRATAPVVTGVAIGAPMVGDTFERGDTIEVTVTFSKAVDVSGTRPTWSDPGAWPQLALRISSQTRQAGYTSGTGTVSLVFRYVVVQTDADHNGISILANALGLNGGTIDVAGGTTDALLGLGANRIGNSRNHKVAGGTFTASAVSGAAITSTPASGSTYGLDEQIEVQLTFTRPVTVTGTPQLALGIGTATRQASYASSPSTATVLVFRYTVQVADSDADGLSVGATALTLNGGTINDARSGGGAASLGLGTNAIANDGNHRVDVPPEVTGVAIGSPAVGDTFERGEAIEATVTFNKAVDVSGTPQLALGVGSATRQASYASGTGTASLVFAYTVVQTDADADGLSIGADALGLNSGTIVAAGGTTDALLGLGASAIENSGSHKVAGGTFTASAVNGAAIASSPASGSTYGLGERIEVAVTFTRPVTVSGAPQLTLGIGTATRQANYVSGTGTDSLTFRYAVMVEDRDSDGLSVGASALGLNSGTINDARAGATAASLGLGTNAIANDGDHRVDGSQGPPGVTGVAIGAPVVGDTFERGEAIEVTVTFNKAVDVSGTPQLALGIGTATRQASYASGTGTASLVFRYVVVSGDADTDGLSIGADALGLNSGTIDVAGGTTDALLGLGASAIENSGSHKVAGGTFTASAVSDAAIASSPASGSTYGLGEQIEVAVTFTRLVTVTGTPQLALVIGTETRQANYVSGTGTDSLTFRYAVMAADRDADGLSVGASALGLNSGTINDARAGATAASLGLGTNAIANDGDHRVDGSQGPPGVTGVAIGSPTVGDTYERGEAIEVTVTFNKAVDVSGTPQLALGIGTATRQASYASGTGTASLVFRYVVVQADADTDGLSIGADALGLNSGTIDVAGGTTDALLGLGANAIENSGSHKVAGGTFTAAAVSGATIASSPVSGSTYGLGEQIEVQLTFTRPVTVSGTPQLGLGVGTATRQASYASSPSTGTVLVFRYTVQAADRDADGLSVGASALGLNSGTINDARAGATAASLGLGTNAITNSSSHRVDGSQGPPGVTGVAIGAPTVGDTFERGEAIEVTVTFNKAVDVSGTPQLALGIGTQTRQASYASGTGTASLVFRYTVASGDADTDGLSIGTDALGLNSGTIDVAGGTTDALLGLGASAIENSGSHKVAGGTFTAAAVSGAAIASTPASGSTYGLSEQIEVQLTFNRAVTVTGTPQLALGVGTATRQASYASSPSTGTVLVFRYTVQAADRDSDGLSVGATALGLNSGTINDARDGTTAASLGLGTNAITNSSGHKVDGAQGPPGVTGVAIGAPVVGDTFERGEAIEATVTFNKAVDVSGTPQLALGIGTETRQASYASGTGTASLVFEYTVVQTDADADGLSIGADALELNSGTIDVAGGTTDALLDLGASAIENSGSHKVAGGTFTASAVSGAAIASSPASGSTYGLSETIEVAVTFTRPVTVSGAPQLTLGIGTEMRQANYVSGTGTDSLTFRYAVMAADRDADGISVGASALGLNSGTINDARAGATAASLGLGTNAIANDGDHRVDGSQGPPGVTGVTIGAPTVGDTFERGEAIEVTVTFNKAVDVSGTPQLALRIGTQTRQASYASGTGTASLAFRYTVASGDADSDGVSIGADALGLNSGTIDVADGTTDALLGLGASAIENSGSHKVAGGTFTAAAVSGAAIASSPASGSTYGLSETIEVAVTFTRPVTVTGTPQLALGIGTETRQANYVSGTGTDSLTFRYAVMAADRDADGLSVGASALGLNSGTINDARDGATAASLGLGTNAIANDGDHKVDGSQGPPGVTGVAIGAPVVDDTFERGEAIEVTVTFNKAVDVNGTPQLALGIGTQTRQASYASGTGTASLVFRYTVVSGDVDADGLSIGADALGLNSGTIDVAGGTTDALLGLGASAIENSGSHKVAGGTFTAAAVSGAAIASSPVSGSTYGLGEQIQVQLTFTRPVTVSGTPQLALGVGTATRQAAYASSTATTLTFQYTVQVADRDSDGLSVGANALGLNSGTINDARAGATAASLGLGTNAIANDGDHKVDGSQGPPGVTGVAIGSPAVGDTFERGDTIEATVTFNKAVDVSGTPQLALGIGTQTRQASYASGTGTASLVFRYVVVQADADTDGLSIGADALGLNSGTIDVAGGTTDALLGLGASAIENSGSHKVAGGTFTAAAASGAAIASSPASGSTYGLSELIEVRVTFDRAVVVTGTPQLALRIGTATRQASYASSPSTGTVLVFRYTVQAADSDANGISVGATALGLNGGTINDARDGTTAASPGLGTNAIANDGNHRVDGAQGPPGVTGVAIGAPAVGDTFERGEAIEVTVTFNKAVDVSGTPQLALGIGSATRQASYASGTGTASLVFAYTVVQADADTDGLSIGANALGLNSGTIDVAGGTLDALLGLGANAITNSGSHKVAGGTLTASAVSAAAMASTPASGNTYVRGEQIEVAVTFNRPVTVTGTPQLALGIGTETRQANYASGTGTASLTFRYTVVAADSDSDGLSVGTSALTLNSGTINDARDATVAASLGLGTNAITNSSSHRVDGSIAAASVDDVSLSSLPESGDAYGLAELIEVRVTFDRAVVVTGTPQLALGIGTATRQADYASGTGTASLTFGYRVQSADEDTDGLSVGLGALALNGGTIINALDGVRPAMLALGAHTISNDALHKVDGAVETAPAVSGVLVESAPGASGAYGPGSVIVVHVEFDRLVEVTGEPQLALTIGPERRRAAYASGSGTAVLVFRYTVLGRDLDPNGFGVPADALELNGGEIVIAGGSAGAELGLGSHAMSDLDGQEVNGGGGTDPYFGVSKYEFELTEDVAGPLVMGTVGATDPYGGELTYVLGDGSEGLFELDASSGELTYVGTGEDAERRSEYLMEVRAEAGDGRVGTALASVKVLNVNDAPVFVAEEFAFELAENAVGPVVLGVAEAVDLDEGDTLTYRMEAGDGERFEVDAETGEVRYVGGGEDYEGGGPRSWELEVSATDLAGLRVGAKVAVALTNVNEAPSFADSAYAFELGENAVGPVVLGRVRATDPDAGDRLTYGLASGDAARFEVDGTSGEVRYVGGGEDAETGPASWELVVSATDGGGIEVEARATVSLLDVNEGPRFGEPSYEYEIEENAPGPIDLGVVGATDPDRADTLTYSLAGEDAERFEVDGASGEVRYVGGGEDAETGPAGWEFEVVVADRDGLTDRARVTVALLDVNEAPAFADSAYAFELAENARGPRDLGRVKATDVDAGDVLTYGLASGDAARFEVDGTSGEVRYVGGGENYEDGPPRYALVVRVVDAGGLADEAGVVVTVLDVNEGPEAVGGIAPKVLEAYGAAAEEELGPYFRDPDGDALSYAAESSAPGVALAAVTESGRLSIAPQAIGVATVTVRATDPGGLEAMQEVQVTVEASRSERERALKLALTAFGRSVGAETVDAIGGRLGVESSSALGRSHVRLGGRSVGCGAFGGGGGETCGLATLARGASGLLGARLSIPAATLVGPAGSPGATIDAATLLFGGGGAQGKGGFGFGGGGTYQGQQESAAEIGPGGLEFDPVSRRNLLSQSSFQLSFGGGAASFSSDADSLAAPPQAASRAGWTLWGQASAGEFEGVPDDGFALEGRTRSAYAGLDYRFGSGLLLGLAGSRSGMESDFESGINGAGSVDARLTSLYPYLHWSPREGLGLWGTAGAGRGSADFEELAGGRFSTDLDMRMGALGARQELVGALALKADAFSVRIQSADATDLAGVTANAQRVRLAPELSGQWAVGGASVRTRLELGGRLDRGDAETGLGAEAGAELGFTHRATGFSVDARGRTLLIHQAEDFKEWNASVALRLQPGRDQGGLSFSLEPSWGAGGGGAGALWQTRGRLGPGPQAIAQDDAVAADAPGLTPNRLAMELGWGAVLPGGGQIRPFGRWSREGTGGYRLNVGTQWSVLGGQPGEGQGQGAPGLRLMIDLFGEQANTSLQPTERRMGLLGRIEFR